MAPRGSDMRWVLAVLPGLLLAGCIDDPAPPPPGTPVFRGGFEGVEPKAFGDSRLNALSIDDYQTHGGARTIRVDVPMASATPGYAGGPFEAAKPLDLSGSTALAFWAKASRPAVLDKLGFGLVFNDPSIHQVTVFDLPLTEAWTHHVIPIPDPARLTAERGLFWYADNDPVNYSFWLADMAFVQVDEGLLDLRPRIGATAVTVVTARKAKVPLVLSYADLDGTRRLIDDLAPGGGPAPGYFTFSSSDSTVATVDATGTITGINPGQAVIEVKLRGRALPRTLAVDVVATIPAAPTAGPPEPTAAAADVKSLFSDAYPPAVTGVVFGTSWSNSVNGVECPSPQWPNCGNRTDLTLEDGDNVQRYTGLNFVGIDLNGRRIDASDMTHVHVDVWTPNATKFGLKLVSFPAAGGQVERQVSFNTSTTNGGTTPLMSQGAWIQLDVPLALFPGLPLDTIGQLLFLDNAAVPPGGNEAGTFFIDNLYFHR